MQQLHLTDPLRDQLRLRDRDRLHLDMPTVVTEGVTITSSNPWATGTPTPGSSYGPGSGS